LNISESDIVPRMKAEELSVIKLKSNLRKILDPEDIAKRVGVKPLVIVIIALLKKKDMHGYEVLQNMDFIPRKPSYGQLYPLLHQMEKAKLIKGKWKERKKVYSLTAEGKKAYIEAKTLMFGLIGYYKLVYGKLFL